ncbi:MAG: aminotransferase class III-fold pyridoxal phosphate-dependent enzyme, partial [Myxococcota bacterium]|nr:aminotransferase class III-fold pyridoxal phosphate-dependent enzyme [Myxococcota bacterium]
GAVGDGAAARRVLAFEGSFHGRTMLALYASHSPGKRVPFELAGYEAVFAPWPTWDSPGSTTEPSEPEGFRALCAEGDDHGLRARFGASEDALLRAEVRSLSAVAEALRGGECFAVIVEPMQSEGGDRYATARFHRGLRLITRALRAPLVMDEVQCGFGLGGSFAWHHRFELCDAAGAPDAPDCVTFAKRAQVGVVMTRFSDPEPTQAYAASLIRGRLHASMIRDSEATPQIEAWVAARLPELERRWGACGSRAQIANVRATGYAIAFDLGAPADLDAYLGQRFWRGVVAFGAGDRTVRYRLNASFEERDVERVFRAIHQSLAWLEAHPGKKPPAWEDLPGDGASASTAREVRIRRVGLEDAELVIPVLIELESRVYEPARQDTPERLRLGLEQPDGIALIAEVEDPDGTWTLAGYAIAAPLERVPEVSGPDRDPARGRGDTLYSVALTVDPAVRGAGIGRLLKQAQLEVARATKRPDGTPRYRWVTGRNRLGHADAMVRLNDSLGAFSVRVLEQQYGEDATARYYRQPLGPLAVEGGVAPAPSEHIDLASGIVAPLADAPASLLRAEREGLLAGPTIEKVTLLNYVTPAAVRAIEWAAALSPDLPHVFLSSGRDEAIDKAIRMLRWHRKGASVVLSMRGNYVGHTTACARSISDPETHAMGSAHFAWPLLPHPGEVGDEASEAALRDAIVAAGGADAVLGIVVESIQERTGRVLARSFAERLEKVRADTGVPIVVVDTAGAYHRGGAGAFASDAWGVLPDARVWWTGGQLGMVHVGKALWVPTPMTFVSTWDGDELSLIQMHHQLRAARRIDVAAGASALDEALASVRARGMDVRGAGLYRVIAAGERADGIADALRAKGVVVRRHPRGHLAIAPALDRAVEHARRLGEALEEALAE